MTEAEAWTLCTDPRAMIECVARTGSSRKLRLFAVACCRRIQHVFPDQTEIEPRLSVAERYADGLATGEELRRQQAYYLCGGGGLSFEFFGEDATTNDARMGACIAQCRCEIAARRGLTNLVPPRLGFFGRWRQFFRGRPEPTFIDDLPPEYQIERLAQCSLVRDIFGNPFRPVAFSPEWRTSTAVELAQGIYDERAFDRMPILADALQDAGCDNDDILTHCRDEKQPHVRGCWVVDAILGKS